jgi:hypothetical protein
VNSSSSRRRPPGDAERRYGRRAARPDGPPLAPTRGMAPMAKERTSRRAPRRCQVAFDARSAKARVSRLTPVERHHGRPPGRAGDDAGRPVRRPGELG